MSELIDKTLPANVALSFIEEVVVMLPSEYQDGNIIIAKKIASMICDKLWNEANTTLPHRPQYWKEVKRQLESIT